MSLAYGGLFWNRPTISPTRDTSLQPELTEKSIKIPAEIVLTSTGTWLLRRSFLYKALGVCICSRGVCKIGVGVCKYP